MTGKERPATPPAPDSGADNLLVFPGSPEERRERAHVALAAAWGRHHKELTLFSYLAARQASDAWLRISIECDARAARARGNGGQQASAEILPLRAPRSLGRAG